MADPNYDFGNYMEEMKRGEAEFGEREEMLRSHEEWRQTTWGGWFVTSILTVGNHFRPFFLAVADAVAEDRSLGRRLVSHFVRMSMVLVVLTALYIVGKLIQMVVGDEIVSEQEIVIVEEIPRSRAEREGIVEGEEELSPAAAKAQLAKLNEEQAAAARNKDVPRRSARDKKKQ